jgi:CheY-like chemotaxis protein
MKPIKILIAEDSEFGQLMLEQLALSLNYEYIIVGNGLEVIDGLNEYNDFNLILMDIEMPKMTGTEATKYIRSNFEFPVRDIPIIAMTAYNEKKYLDEIMQSGLTGYIIKPFSKTDLQQIVDLYLSPDYQTTQNSINAKEINLRHYNLSDVNEFADGDTAFIKQMLKVFLTDTPLNIQKIKDAYATRDYYKLRETAHKFKPHTSFLRIHNAEKNLIEIEEMTHIETNRTKLQQLIETIENECTIVIDEIKKDFCLSS